MIRRGFPHHLKVGAPLNRVSTEAPTASNFERLQNQIDRQHLLIQTLMRLLIEKGMTSEQELNEWVEYIDRLDGNPDARITKSSKLVICFACDRVNRDDVRNCLFCGQEMGYSVVETPDPHAPTSRE